MENDVSEKQNSLSAVWLQKINACVELLHVFRFILRSRETHMNVLGLPASFLHWKETQSPSTGEATCPVEAVRMCCSSASGQRRWVCREGPGCCTPHLPSHLLDGSLWLGTQSFRRDGEYALAPKEEKMILRSAPRGFQTYWGTVLQESVSVQFFILGVHIAPPTPSPVLHGLGL